MLGCKYFLSYVILLSIVACNKDSDLGDYSGIEMV